MRSRIPQKKYRLIRTDGIEQMFAGEPSTSEVEKLIGCKMLDTVTINRRFQTVMFVDDTGMVDNQPVNEKATKLARVAFGQDYPFSIHGHVVIVNDKDFE